MHTMDPKQLSPSARKAFGLIELDADEKLLFEVRKHWWGLFQIYFIGSFVTAVLLAIALTAAAITEDTDLGTGADLTTLRMPVIAICFLLAVFVTIVTAIAAYLYRSNVVLVTTEKVVQVLNPSLFNRKISQLSIGDVQDVSVHQRGIFPHLLRYGTVVIETAGEQQNYNFTYTPEPYDASKVIVNAHEENLKLYGN
ncbi:MAG TPA: PH domain-containing protein [Candidatus Limnocylindria bacterium]|nr:PH domain-containing protein [Candidatus Limnocylindria bacterium]